MLYWVNPRESIINAKATQKYKPLLQMINSGASDTQIAKQLNPQEANYNTTANVGYFHKFGVTNTQKRQSKPCHYRTDKRNNKTVIR